MAELFTQENRTYGRTLQLGGQESLQNSSHRRTGLIAELFAREDRAHGRTLHSGGQDL